MDIRYAKTHEDAREPTRGTVGAAGYDLYAAEEYVIHPGDRAMINTGVSFEIPEGYYGRVAPRSGLASKYGIDVLAGVADSDYRGTIYAILINHGKEDFHVKKGDRVAQFIFEHIAITSRLVEVSVEELTQTERGACGFGSTGR